MCSDPNETSPIFHNTIDLPVRQTVFDAKETGNG